MSFAFEKEEILWIGMIFEIVSFYEKTPFTGQWDQAFILSVTENIGVSNSTNDYKAVFQFSVPGTTYCTISNLILSF